MTYLTIKPAVTGTAPGFIRRGAWMQPAANGALLLVLAWLAWPLFRWAVIDAVFLGNAGDCNAEGSGACWRFIHEKFRFILFGFFPPGEQWRPATVIVIIVGLAVLSAFPRFWSRRLLLVWLAAFFGLPLLMAGAGLVQPVATNNWGGLPVTLLVSVGSMILAFPIAIALALARKSSFGLLRMMAIAYIELLRAVPMVVVLYVAMLIVPMALPQGMLIDKLLRAQIGVTIFTAAYLAEIIRAGLQTVAIGQRDAGAALGLTGWQVQRLVILPQALRAVIPAMVNLAVGILLNTSLLAVIGIYDLLNTAKASAADPQWLGFYGEAYLLAAVIYFSISYALARYSRWLERYLRATS